MALDAASVRSCTCFSLLSSLFYLVTSFFFSSIFSSLFSLPFSLLSSPFYLVASFSLLFSLLTPLLSSLIFCLCSFVLFSSLLFCFLLFSSPLLFSLLFSLDCPLSIVEILFYCCVLCLVFVCDLICWDAASISLFDFLSVLVVWYPQQEKYIPLALQPVALHSFSQFPALPDSLLTASHLRDKVLQYTIATRSAFSSLMIVSAFLFLFFLMIS